MQISSDKCQKYNAALLCTDAVKTVALLTEIGCTTPSTLCDFIQVVPLFLLHHLHETLQWPLTLGTLPFSQWGNYLMKWVLHSSKGPSKNFSSMQVNEVLYGGPVLPITMATRSLRTEAHNAVMVINLYVVLKCSVHS